MLSICEFTHSSVNFIVKQQFTFLYILRTSSIQQHSTCRKAFSCKFTNTSRICIYNSLLQYSQNISYTYRN